VREKLTTDTNFIAIPNLNKYTPTALRLYPPWSPEFFEAK